MSLVVGVGRCPAQACHLGSAGTGVDEQAQDRRVAPAGEGAVRVNHAQQCPELGLAQDGGRLLGGEP